MCPVRVIAMDGEIDIDVAEFEEYAIQ